MRYLLDTCVVSEYAKRRPNPGLVEWLRHQNEAGLYVSVLTLGEVIAGVERIADPERRAVLRDWVRDGLAERFAGRLVPIDAVVARAWGELCASAASTGAVLPAVDSLIAASALCHGMAVATRNEADFARTGVPVVNPWT